MLDLDRIPRRIGFIKAVRLQSFSDTKARLFMETFRLVDKIIHPQFAGAAGDVKPGLFFAFVSFLDDLLFSSKLNISWGDIL